MGVDRRYKLLKSGLPGDPAFDVGDLSDGQIIEWDSTTGKWVISTGLEIQADIPTVIGDGTSSYLDLELSNGTLVGYVGADASEAWLGAYGNSSDVALYTNNSSGVAEVALRATADGATQLFEDATLAAGTVSVGWGIYPSTTGTNPGLLLYDSTPTERARLYATSANLGLRSVVHGSTITLEGEDAGGTLRNVLVGDPDGGVNLYYTGIKALDSHAGGASIYDTSGDDPFIAFFQDDTSTRNGFIQFLVGSTVIRNEVHGAPVYIQSENISGTNTSLIIGDPDTGVAVNGQAPVAPPTYTVSTYTTDRALSASPTTTELRDVLASLIVDLQAFGCLQ